MDGKESDGFKLEVTLFKNPAERGIIPGSSQMPKRQFNNLFVKNIPEHFTSEQLAVSHIFQKLNFFRTFSRNSVRL